MSTPIPLRTVRIPALQRQCLFQRRQCLNRPFQCSASQPFSSSAPRPYKKNAPRIQDMAQTEAAAAEQTGPSPAVNYEKAQQDSSGMAEDIGLLQHTIVRAPFKDLPSVTSYKFWAYFWKLIKAKGTAFYSRSYYRRCIQKTGWTQWVPIDTGKNAELKAQAQKLYEQIYINFAKGDTSSLKQICLPPIAQKFENRILSRGPLKMDWKLLKWRSARVVSHRASPLGEDHPDTAYRQAVIRLESVQSLSMTEPHQQTASSRRRGNNNKGPAGLAWVPEEAKAQRVRAVQREEGGFSTEGEFVDNGKNKSVVEYLVLQNRVIKGKEEEWKVWGFAEESTPAKIEEDELYWRKTLAIQIAGGA